METPPASGEGAVSQVRTSWVETEEFVEDDLELVLCERWFHILDAVYVGQPGDVVKEGWSGVVVAVETAYTVGKAGTEAMCWAQLRSVVESDGEV